MYQRVSYKASYKEASLLKIVTQGLSVEIKQEDGVIQKQDAQHQNDSTAETKLAYPSDSMLHT